MNLFEIFGTVAINNTNANTALDQTNNKAKTVATELSKSFENIGSAFSKIGEGMTKAGTFMTATLTTGIIGLATAGLKYNAQMETFEANLSTLLGNSDKAKALLSDLQDMASTTPYETTDLISATQTMMGFGISAEDAQNYLTVLGDIAMGNSEKMSGLALAFSQVQSTGKLTGQDLLQMINQGFNPLLYLSEMTGKSMSELKEEMSDGAISAEMVADAFKYATQEGQPFYNAMEKGADTVNGRLSTLKDNFNIMIGRLTEGLLPILEKVVDKLIELTDKFSNLSEEQKENILKWGAFLACIGPALIGLGKITTAIGSLTSGIGTLVGWIGAKGAEAGATGAMSSLGVAGSSVATVLGVVAAVVAALASVFIFLKRNWDKVVEVFQNFVEKTGLAEKFEEIKEKIQPLWEKLKGLGDLFEVIGAAIVIVLMPAIQILVGLFDAVISAISPLIDFIGGVIDVLAGLGTFIKSVFTGDWQGAWDAVLKMSEGGKNAIVGFFTAIWEFLKGFIEGIWSWKTSIEDALGFTDFLNNLWSKIKEWGEKAWNWLKGLWDKICNVVSVAFQLIGSIIDAAWQIISLPFKFIWENCKEYVFKAWEWIKEKISEGVNKVKSVITTGFNIVKSYIQTVWNAIKEHIITPITNAYNKVKDFVAKIKEIAVNKFNEAKAKVAEIWNNIKEKISTPINQAKTKVSEVINNIKSNILNGFNILKNKVTTVWNNIKTAIETPINKAKDTVKKVVDKIKGFFDGLKLKLPHIKLPHFKIDGKLSLNPPSVPKLKIDWYKDGGIFAKPTLFPTANGIKGVGEAGPEAVAPISKLQDYVKVAISESNSRAESKLETLIDILLKYLPALEERQLVLDTGAVVGEMTTKIDRALGELTEKKARGR